MSPLLANIMLDPLDKELERRGHKFARYADDYIILVKSQRAGERVLRSITQYLQNRLKLVINTEKSQVVRSLFERDSLNVRWDGVYLPYALEKKYPRAPFEFSWQYLFPADAFSIDPCSGKQRRHHISEQSVQRAVKAAVRKANIHKPASCHSLRHSFATHLLQNGADI